MAQPKIKIEAKRKKASADAAVKPSRAALADSQSPDSSTDEPGTQSWNNLLELDSQIFEQKGVRLLTPEARVLIHLKLNGTMTVSTAMEKAGVSYRGFYTVLERLKQAGLVGQAKDKEDQRVRQLRLDPSMPLPSDRF